MALTNITVGAVRVRVRARARGHDLDDAVHVELLPALAARAPARLAVCGVSACFRLERGDTKILRARAWIPRRADGYEGRRARVSLALRTELTGARP